MTGSALVALVVLAAQPAARSAAPGFDPNALDGVETPRRDLQLEPRRDGSYVYRDADSRFRAVIRPDGTVEYLRPAADVHLSLFGFDLLHRGRSEPDPRRPGAPDPSPLRGSADPTHDPNSYGPVPILIGFGGRMPGMADMVQRGREFASKARFLDDTAALRRELARQVSERHTRERLGSLEAELDAIWTDPEQTMAERRARLFERWDECAEPPEPGDEVSEEDARRAEAGERGRRQIEAFVRRHAPAGGAFAYSAAELQRLNARRRSRSSFEPYAGAIEPGQGETSTAQ